MTIRSAVGEPKERRGPYEVRVGRGPGDVTDKGSIGALSVKWRKSRNDRIGGMNFNLMVGGRGREMDDIKKSVVSIRSFSDTLSANGLLE